MTLLHGVTKHTHSSPAKGLQSVVKHSHPFNAELQNEWSLSSRGHLNGVSLRHRGKFILLFNG